MLYYIFFFIFMILSIPGIAKEQHVKIINAGSPTGSTMTFSKVLSDELKLNNISSEIIVVGDNCAQAKNIWDKNQNFILNALHFFGTYIKDNQVCYIPSTIDNILFWIYSAPFYLCSVSDVSLIDLRGVKRYKIASDGDNLSHMYLSKLLDYLNSNSIIVKIPSAGAGLTYQNLIIQKEIDFVFAPTEFKGTTCLFSTLKNNPFNIPYVNDIWPHFRHDAPSYNALLSYNNMSIELKSVVLISAKKAWENENTRKFRQSRKYDDSIVDYTSSDEYILKLNKLLSIINYK
jgi:hypothetical protein